MRFLEIGASDKPKWEHLLDEGWKGVFVEAHPAAFQKLVTRLANKNGAEFVLAAVSDKREFGVFRGFREDFSKTTISLSLDSSVQYKNKETTDPKYRGDMPFHVPTVTLSEILTHIGTVDKIRIDVEGEEIPILLNYDFSVKPRVFSIEFHNDTEGMQAVVNLLKDQGYSTENVTEDIGGIEEHQFILNGSHDVTMLDFPQHYKPQDKRLSVSIPIYSEKQIKGAVLSAISIINNTDLGEKRVPVFFHIDKVFERMIVSGLERYNVPTDMMRIINNETLPQPILNHEPRGRRLMGLFDPQKINNVVLIVAPHTLVCTTGQRLQWYETLSQLKTPAPLGLQTTKYSDWIQGICLAVGRAFVEDMPHYAQECAVIGRLGFEHLPTSPGGRQGTQTNLLAVPTSHPIMKYLTDNLEVSYQDEYLLALWQMQHNEMVSLQAKFEIPFYENEKSFADRNKDKDTDGYVIYAE